MTVKSWVPEVIADETGTFVGNGLRFEAEKDAERWAWNLSMRWFAVREWRAAPSDDEVNVDADGNLLKKGEE